MSSGSAEVASAQKFARGGRGSALNGASAAYLVAVAAAASALVAPFGGYSYSHTDWLLFVALAACASAAQVLVNHVLLAQMLRLARGKSYRESGLFTFASLSTELVLALLGAGTAAVWVLAPPLVPFVLAPLVVVHRSLELPSLQMAARLDAK